MLTALTSTNAGFVNLNAPREPITSRPHHRSSELVQPLPSSLVAPWLNDSSQAKGVGTIFLRRDLPHRAKPQPQRLTSAMENCTSSHRSLSAAVTTMPQPALRPPRLSMGTLPAKGG